MIEFLAHNLAPIMFVSVMAMLLLGYPVAFTLAAGGLFYFVIGVEFSELSPQITLFWTLLGAQPDRVFGIMSNDTLLAVPFFTFMGLVLERSRMAEDLLETIGQLFGPVRGGLGYAAVLVGALLAATTGVVAASVIAMGLISLPIMLRYGYDRSFATGTIAASGTLAQIVPPSLVLIVMADQLGRSVGDMYVGALYPALLMIGLYLLYTFAVTIVRPDAAPALPPEARTLGGGVWSLIAILLAAVIITVVTWYTVFAGFRDEVRDVWAVTTGVGVAYAVALLNRAFGLGLLSRLAQQVVIVLIPPLALIFLVLGTIFLGIATPTEGGAMGATGALAMAFSKGRLTLKVLTQALESTAKLSAFVLFILIGARVFGLTFYGINGNIWIEELLLAIPGDEYGFLIAVTILIFILGCFLDFFEIAFILIPLLAPVAEKLGIDLIWFGVLIGINLQTSFLTPPFGFSLFYLRSIAPAGEWLDKVTGRTLAGVSTPAIYKGALPFILINALMIAIVMAFPGLVTRYKGDVRPPMDPAEFRLQIPTFGGEGGMSLPPLGGNSGTGQPNDAFGLPPLGLPGTAPGAAPAPDATAPAPPTVDLSQPPAFQ
ncbi:TRAP transporter large permease subunit [Aurantimonas sp. C2-6-R+9]|uniref:TRAP transporter large permease n=1 Tax=unclassified Aurantimonas TaxID=2638230 RepID=UPI002E187424|nr:MULTISPECIES: TRAP transporter large permease subunit [unclassified Aurantimonas]MEC5293180.1 TRAP transporter large permease subunit [Aurantimonas sp. C2-3-R2]MEC5383326.1 TRAP transporter large permease subunit [Aurantimonas sp. C2-6-R+9]MEC5414275.1 TRAP transporter large permease subunit [Aurantimonas sp. C2-4-R8]